MKLKYNSSRNDESGEFLGQVQVGERKFKLYGTSFETRGGGTGYAIRLTGLGKPTIFGAVKWIALQQLQDQITQYFVDKGQIELEDDEED
ncbi:MAG: hypothetical protein DRP09_20075 [Candidatus Thorarchaeota archaeon]|nr:MAG: hypothetical protein DRP09_20075 [Candidatus Thorarchaeota archaeon]